jgi:hypothetical protein
MSRVHVFADEAGNFDFSRNVGASRYFILTTVTMDTCAVGDALTDLRRQLSWEGHDLSGGFHANHDSNVIRARVFDELMKHEIRVDSVILDKPKAQPQTHLSEPRFYQYAWFYHFKHVGPLIFKSRDELFVIAAALETKRKRGIFHAAVRDVVNQVTPATPYSTAFWPAAGEPCLQAADYCCWAVQRKWEGRDPTWHAKIAAKIRTEYDLWSPGRTLYY